MDTVTNVVTLETKLVDIAGKHMPRFISHVNRYFQNTREDFIAPKDLKVEHLFEIEIERFVKFRDVGHASITKLEEIKASVEVERRVTLAEQKWNIIFSKMRQYFREEDAIAKHIGFSTQMVEDYLKRNFDAPEQISENTLSNEDKME
jgi:hypothetical protein